MTWLIFCSVQLVPQCNFEKFCSSSKKNKINKKIKIKQIGVAGDSRLSIANIR